MERIYDEERNVLMLWCGSFKNNWVSILLSRTCLLAVAVLLVASSMVTGCSGGAPQVRGLKYVSSFEGGHKYQLGKLDVLVLSGTYNEMGRQYGSLMMKKLHECVAYVDKLLAQPNAPVEFIDKINSNPLNRYPERLRQIVVGMSETAGLSVKKLGSIDLNYCSAEVAWGPYTGGGPLVVGRNNDFPGLPPSSNRFSNFVVYNPSDGSMPCAFFADVGSVAADTGYNSNGLMIESNDGLEGSKPQADRMLFALEMTQFMFDSANLETLCAEVSSTRPNMPQLCLVGDKGMGVSYELNFNDYRRVAPVAEGLVVQTNDFVDPYWGQTQSNSATSDQRYKNLLSLANQNKGNINVPTMKMMMSTPMSEGGPFRPGDTVAMQVFVPATMELWIAIPNYQDWAQVPLKALFDIGK
jgi:hypothetical protein